ncbi:MAG: Gfo/Idh/MocA family protein [Eubacterium sp.]
MNDFRWAYIGNGNIAESTARNIIKGNHRITAVYGRTPSKTEKFAKKYGAKAYIDFEEAVCADDVDAVYIATPHTSHVEYAVRAMELGVPVLCEKPVAVCAEDAQRMVKASNENNVYFCEAMWTWFSQVAKTVKKWIENDEIGDITNVEIDYSFPGIMMPKTSRVLSPETAGGALLDIGIYPITYCYNLFGYPDRITCNGEIKNGIDIAETVILEYGQMACTLNMSLTALKEGCRIVGTKGEIYIPMFHMASRAIMKNQKGKTVFKGKTNYLIEFEAVAKEINDGGIQSKFIPHQTTIDCMKIIDVCRNQMGLVYPFEK